MKRRNFLKTSAALPFVSPLMISNVVDEPSKSSTYPWVRKARRSIPATSGSFFQTAGIGPSPKIVMDSVSKILAFQNNGPVDPNIYSKMSKIEPGLREHLADMFGAYPDEIALTHSTSEGINIASWSINWKKGDRVLISNQEHPANTIPWYSLAKRYGIAVDRLDFSSDTNIINEIKSNIGSKTRMVSIPHISRNNGRALTVEESKEIAAILRSKKIRYHLDGAQGPLCASFDFHDLGSDYYSTCGHKWIMGPKGTGVFFCRREMLNKTLLTWTGSHSHETMDQIGNFTLIPAARRFEFGTRALATFAGFDTALHWNEDIGIDRIIDRIDFLVDYAIKEWSERGFKISSPINKKQRSGVFVLKLPGNCNGWDVYKELRLNKNTYTSPVDEPKDLRVAIHFFNTRDEIKKLFNLISVYCKK